MFVPTLAFLRSILGASPPPPPPPAITRLKDLFIGADNTHLEDHAMNVGSGWTQTGSQDFRIFSDSANDHFGDDGACLADAGVADGSVSATLSTSTHTIYGGLAFNGEIGANAWAMVLDSAGEAATILDPSLVPAASSAFTVSANTTYRLRVEISGDHVACYVDDALVVEVTVADRPQKGDTGFGLFGLAGSSGDDSTFNAFEFRG